MATDTANLLFSKRVSYAANGVVSLANEQTILTSDGNKLVVTSHRVRYVEYSRGTSQFTSMMLDAVVSCRITHTSRPWLLALALLALLFAITRPQNDDGVPQIVGYVLAALFVAAYFGTRRQVLEIASAAARINVLVRGMTLEKTTEIVTAIEDARARSLVRTS